MTDRERREAAEQKVIVINRLMNRVLLDSKTGQEAAAAWREAARVCMAAAEECEPRGER